MIHLTEGQGRGYGGRLRCHSEGTARWHVHPPDRQRIPDIRETPSGKILKQAEPNPLPSTRNRFAPLLGPFQAVIDQILIDDETAPPKQRHTAAQVFRRLRDEHDYRGGYAQVQRYLRKHRPRHQETFIPLGHLPGQRLEADFGHIHVDFPDGRRLVPFLVTAWAYSNAPFVLALPFERTEAILEGMVAAFEFFGAVPKEVWWDNPKTVATLILLGRERQCHPRYAALASHYVFAPLFCMPARGNEKPDAEGTVKAVQKRFATPVPRVANLDELNTFFRKRCEAERDRVVQSLFGPFTIKDRLAEDLAAASPLPEHRFDPCVIKPAVAVDKYQTVAFDGNRYSVPRRPFAFQMVTVKGYVDQGRDRGPRPDRRHSRTILGETDDDSRPDPLPRDAGQEARRTGPFAGLPRLEAPRVLRRRCVPNWNGLHGAMSGSRRFVQVLQLLGEHPMSRVTQAIEACQRDQLHSAEAVIQRTRSLAAIEATKRDDAGRRLPKQPAAPRVDVPLPDLSRFNQLLSSPAADGPVSVFFA